MLPVTPTAVGSLDTHFLISTAQALLSGSLDTHFLISTEKRVWTPISYFR